MKILFIVETPSPYRVAFFRQLGKLCNLTVLFTRDKKHYGRHDSWYDFDFIGFSGITPGGRIGRLSLGVSKYINRKYDLIILCDYASPTGIYISLLMRMRGIRYAIESDGGFPKDGKGIKEWIKKKLISRASWWFSTADITDSYLLKYGAEKDKIFRYPFTSISECDITQSSDSQRKSELRLKLGIDEKKVIITVGQFIHRKGFDVLLQACKSIDNSIGVYIIGGEPTPEYIALKNNLERESIHFVDFMPKEVLKEYYDAADLFVLPTREDIWGLVVNEAMARGLPVIATDRCIGGTELVRDGENGYIVPAGDSDVLAERINAIIGNGKTLEGMSASSQRRIRRYTYEEMAERHIEIFSHIIDPN